MHFIVAACLLQFRGYFLTKYSLIGLKRHLQIPKLSLQKTICPANKNEGLIGPLLLLSLKHEKHINAKVISDLKRVIFNLDLHKIVLTFLVKNNCITSVYTFFNYNFWNLLEFFLIDQIRHFFGSHRTFKQILRSI